MSSILRALKKLEEGEESRELDPGNEKITMRRVINRKTGGIRRIDPMIYLLISVLVLGVAVGVFINSGIRPEVEDGPKKVDVTSKSAVIEEKPGLIPAPKPESPEETPAPVEEPVKPTQREETPVVPQVAPPVAPPPGEEHIPVKPKQPSLVLSGILWSDNPERRVAVINDKFLKEGEVINGVEVVSIEQNLVIVKSGHEKWTLKMTK